MAPRAHFLGFLPRSRVFILLGSTRDSPAGQAVHTGCLSAAPQRFVIGSNSFRTLTCFEVPLHSHCSLCAKAASNCRGAQSPKGLAPPKPIAGGRIAGSNRGHHAPSTTVHFCLRTSLVLSCSSTRGCPRRYLVCRAA